MLRRRGMCQVSASADGTLSVSKTEQVARLIDDRNT